MDRGVRHRENVTGRTVRWSRRGENGMGSGIRIKCRLHKKGICSMVDWVNNTMLSGFVGLGGAS